MASGPQNDDGEALSEVNVIPLADLSLVLLIILMVISPMIMQSMIKVVASKATVAKANPADEKEPPLILAIAADGSLDLNKTKVTDLDLAIKLDEAFSNRIDKSILVTVDAGAQHGRFVSILDIVKQHGAEKISLLKKAGGSASQPIQAAAPVKS